MITFDVINPHDQYTMQAPDFVTALAAIAMIGEGKYGVACDGFNSGLGLFGDFSATAYAAAGIIGCSDLFDVKRGRLQTDKAFNEAVACACESIKRVGKLTSTVNLETAGRLTADALRSKRTFASVEAEA